MKCRCGPVDQPVEPSKPMVSPGCTMSWTWTFSASICPYAVEMWLQWLILTEKPKPSFAQPAQTTSPACAALIGTPRGADMSTPLWNQVKPRTQFEFGLGETRP